MKCKAVEVILYHKKMEYRDTGDCIKCRGHGHELRDCEIGYRASTPTTQDNRKSEKKKVKDKGKETPKKTDSGTLKITKPGSESKTEWENN